MTFTFFLWTLIDIFVSNTFSQSHGSRRDHEQAKKKSDLERSERMRKQERKSTKQLEQESREQGLQTQLDASNKGFAMLQKMGFKPGKLDFFLTILIIIIYSCNDLAFMIIPPDYKHLDSQCQTHYSWYREV